MRMSRTPLFALLAALFWAAPASAQFSNRSLGLTVGYMDIDDADRLDNGIPIGLMGSLYIENGFEAVAHFDVMILREQIASGNKQVVGIAPSIGIRYLFSEEQIRPYAGLDLSFLLTFRDAGVKSYFGLGPNLGIDFFVSSSVSLGVRAQYNLYLTLNSPIQNSIAGQVVAATYF